LKKKPEDRKHAGENKGEGGGNAAAAGDKQLSSCAAEKMKYTALCVQWQVYPRGIFFCSEL
jgi:hypothetical protein